VVTECGHRDLGAAVTDSGFQGRLHRLLWFLEVIGPAGLRSAEWLGRETGHNAGTGRNTDKPGACGRASGQPAIAASPC